VSVSPLVELAEGAASPLELDPLAGETATARSPLQLFWRRFRSDRVAMVSLGFIALLIIAAVAAPLVLKILDVPGPNTQNLNSPPMNPFGNPTGPNFSTHHYFGVDPLGRDVFARTLYGARVSLLIAFVATGLSVLVGVTMGMMAGYFRGWADVLISRVIDILLAFPILLLALGIAAACSLGHGCLGGLVKPGLTVVIFVIAFVNWTFIARIVRGQVLSLREKEFIESARALGASSRRILTREILPNLVAPIVVYGSILIPQNILFEAALSFLGVGVQPPTASWGAMLADATSIYQSAWWYMVFPGVALLLTVLAFNLVGDGLQDALAAKAADY
jgi:ABC-type dipeptide/oligopeptide/nickel transport system permease subunit